jgi:hypothetical protein
MKTEVPLTPGSHHVVAHYSGAQDYGASTSPGALLYQL